MFKTDKSKAFYNRLYNFARDCAIAVRPLPKISSNQIYSRQLIKSSSSIPANYIEAQESLSRKDFLYRLAVCRKESKESTQWLRLIMDTNDTDVEEFRRLLGEAEEFVRIFSKAVRTTELKASK